MKKNYFYPSVNRFRVLITIILLFVFSYALFSENIITVFNEDSRLDGVRELMENGKFDEALTELNEFLEKEPRSAPALAMRIMVNLISDDIEQIIKDHTVFTEISDDSQIVMESVVALCIQKFKDDAAKQILKDILPMYPESDVLLALNGAMKQIDKDFPAAIKNYEKALMLNPDSELALYHLTDIYFEDMQVEKSFKMLDEMQKKFPDSGLTSQMVVKINSGEYWTLDHLLQFFELHDMHFIIDDDVSDEYNFLFINEKAKEEDNWINVIQYETVEVPKEIVVEENEILDEESQNSFAWGVFIIEKGCNLDEDCIKTWEKMKELTSDLKSKAETAIMQEFLKSDQADEVFEELEKEALE